MLSSSKDMLKGRTVFITGGSRGIGLAIAKRVARDGANIVLAAKTAEPHPKLPGTIYTAAKEIEAAGGAALPLQVDIQDEAATGRAFEAAARRFGRIDVLVNNASAIDNSDTLALRPKKYDLMHAVNARGAFTCSQHALRQSHNLEKVDTWLIEAATRLEEDDDGDPFASQATVRPDASVGANLRRHGTG